MFYVYVYSHPDTNQPFYVGKGSGDRKYHHLRTWRTHHNELITNTIQELCDRGQRPIISEVFHHEDEQVVLAEEVRLIQQYGRQDIGTGVLCNKTPGGEGFGNTGTKWSPRQRAKINENNISNPRGRLINQYTLLGELVASDLKPRDIQTKGFTRTQMMRIRLCCRGRAFSVGGFRWSYSDEPLADLHKGKIVHQIDPITREVISTYVTIGEASRHTGVHSNSISACVNGLLCTAGGYVWTSVMSPKQKKNDKVKKVQQMDTEGNVICVHNSIKAAAATLNIDPTGISHVCTGRTKTAGGYRWSFL